MSSGMMRSAIVVLRAQFIHFLCPMLCFYLSTGVADVDHQGDSATMKPIPYDPKTVNFNRITNFALAKHDFKSLAHSLISPQLAPLAVHDLGNLFGSRSYRKMDPSGEPSCPRPAPQQTSPSLPTA